MKQQVNLYQAAPSKPQPPWSAARLAQVMVLALLLLGAASGFLAWDAAKSQQRVADLEARKVAAAARVKELDATLPEPKRDPQLAQRVARLESALVAKRAFLERFSPEALGHVEGFSAWMNGLARQRHEGLWLTAFTFAGSGGLAFEGRAVEPPAIPAFVSHLAAVPAFAGREFRMLQIARDADNGTLKFVLRSAGVEER